MTRKTIVPSIPDPTPDGILDVARAVKNLLDVREGRAGQSEDRFVTFRDLESMSLITDASANASNPGGTGPGTGTGPYNPGTDTTTPPIPTGLRVNGGYGVIMLSWDTPQALYRNHAYTEIWRNSIDALGTATLIGTTIASVYSDPVPASRTYYYWIRFVSQANITGPYNSTSGTSATSAIDVPAVIAALTDQITSSQLYGDLRTRIDLIDSDPSVVGSVAWQIDQQARSTSAAITSVKETIADTTQSLARQADVMTATFGDVYAAVATESLARVNGDGALAQQLTTVQTTANNAASAVTTLEQTKIGYATLNATGEAFDNNGTIRDSAGVTAWNAANPGNLATWNIGIPFATAVKQVRVSNGTDSLTLEQRFTAQLGTNNQLLGQYTVKIDNNGSVSGFGLASTAVDGVPTSEFYINADRFAITAPANATGATLPASPPAGPGGNPSNAGYTFYRTTDKKTYRWTGTAESPNNTWVLFTENVPFVVQATPVTRTVGGVTEVVPPGVYIDAAYIRTGTLTTAVIGTGTITTANITTGAITDATIANGTITTAKIADELKSVSYVTSGGTSGWRIGQDGVAVFNQATIRGTVYASAGSFTGSIYAGSGTIGGVTINNNSLTTSNYSNTNGWSIGSDGSAYFNNITVKNSSGAVIFSSGASTSINWSALGFTGDLNATFGADSNNLRVGVGANLVGNSDLAIAQAPWGVTFVQDGGTNYQVGRDLAGDDWRPTNGHNIGLERTGNALTGIIDIAPTSTNDYITIVPGKRYELSAYVAAHRCDAEVRVWWYNEYNQYVGENTTVAVNAIGGRNLASWARPVAFVNAPSNARSARVGIRTYGAYAGETSAYVWATRFFFGEATAGQTEASPWTPASFGSVSQIGFPITAQNISTYIAGAAIGTAYIGNAAITSAQIQNAAVDTLRIAGSATMVPEYAALSTSKNVTGSYSTDIVSKSYTVSGLGAGESIKVMAIAVLQAYPTNADLCSLVMGIFADGNENSAVASTFAADGLTMSCTGSWLVGNGTYTASIRAYTKDANDNGFAKGTVNFVGQIILMAVKR